MSFEHILRRFAAKLPHAERVIAVPASHIVMALLRLRTSGSNECINGAFHLLTKSVCHSFAHTAERSIEQKLLSECPDPCVLARVHPFMKRATTRGNKSLQMSLVSRWVSRGGGYVSLKDTNLEKLNIVGKRSTLASRTAAEYTARILVKSAECMEESVEKSKVVNFCFDAARVAEEQVSLFMQLRTWYHCDLRVSY